jgi:hypothetical protein
MPPEIFGGIFFWSINIAAFLNFSTRLFAASPRCAAGIPLQSGLCSTFFTLFNLSAISYDY